MAIKIFGSHKKSDKKIAYDYISELQTLAGAAFPITVTVDNDGQLTGITYETEWKEGTTEPVEPTDKKTKKVTITYKENYKSLKLSDAQIKKIDTYIDSTLKKA